MAITFNAATATAGFADLFSNDDASTTWYQLWTGNAAGSVGSFVDTSAYTGEGKGWIEASDLANLKADFAQADDTTLWVRTWNSANGESEWYSGDVTFTHITGPDAMGAALTGVPVASTVDGNTAMDEMFNIENVTDDTWVRIWVGEADGEGGSYLDTEFGNGWVKADKYGTELFPAAENGSTKELWVTLWNNETKYSGWEHWDVRTEASEGQEYDLQLGRDNLVGTDYADTFNASLAQNAFGGTANTLASGDKIDAGGGKDTLMVDLIPEFIGVDIDDALNLDGILEPDTEDLEIVKFHVQQRTTGNTESEALSGVDAGKMDFGVNGEIWSSESRADLIVEDVRHNSFEMTIGMEETQGSSIGGPGNRADLKVDFAADYIEGQGTGQAFIDLVIEDQDAVANGDISGITIEEIQFLYDNDGDGTFNNDINNGGDHIVIDFDTVKIQEFLGKATIDTTTELASYIQQWLAAQVNPVTGEAYYDAIDDPGAFSIVATNEPLDTIRITDVDALDVVNIDGDDSNFQAINSDAIAGQFTDLNGDDGRAWRVSDLSQGDPRWDSDTEGDVPDILSSVNVIFDDVGRGSSWLNDDAEGLEFTTEGGWLDVGSTTTYGVQHFDIQVGRASNVASLTSTNRSQSDGVPTNERLEKITISNLLDDDGEVKYPDEITGLQIGNTGSRLGLIDEGVDRAGIDNVQTIAAETYTGDLNIFLQLDNDTNFEAERIYLDRAIDKAQEEDIDNNTVDPLLEALWLNKVEFNYTMGTGNDLFVLDLMDAQDSLLRDNGVGTEDAITEMNISTGDGNDVIALDFLHEEDYAAGTTYLTANPASTSVTRIDGGDGTDTLEISHSIGSFGDARGEGRAFSDRTWFDGDTTTAGIQGIENLLVSDRFDTGDNDNVYVNFDIIDEGNVDSANKPGGAGNYYEVTNNDITVLDNSVVFIEADYDDAGDGDDDDWATDLVLTGGPANAAIGAEDFNVGDVTVTLEDYGPGYDDITQRVFLQNLGRSNQDLTIASLTINDDDNDAADNALEDVVIYSMGTSESNTNIIQSFESQDIDTLFIANDDLDGVDGTSENAPYNDGDLEDENLTITIADVLDGNNVDEVDASAFTGDLNITALDNISMTILGGFGDDTIDAGKSGDWLTGNGGIDTFNYDAVTESYANNAGTLANMDKITDLNFDEDKIDVSDIVENGALVPANGQIAVLNEEDGEDLSLATLLTDLNAAFDKDNDNIADDGIIYAQIITDDGTDNNNVDVIDDVEDFSFLVVDIDDDGVIEQTDLIINITGQEKGADADDAVSFTYSGTMDADDFILEDQRAPVVGALSVAGNAMAFDSDEAGVAYLTDVGNAAVIAAMGAADDDRPIDVHLQDANGNYYNNAQLGNVVVTDVNEITDLNELNLVAEDTAIELFLQVVDSNGNAGAPAPEQSIWVGTINSDTFAGDASDELFFTFGGVDTVAAGGGDDFVSFGNFASDLDGEGGTDTAFLMDDNQAAAGATVTLGAAGTYTLDGGTTTAATFANFENVDVSAESTIAFDLNGDANANTIIGGGGGDTIDGGDGEDIIDGGAGADEITGGLGADTITTGDGADSVVIDTGLTADTITDFTVGAAGDQLDFDVSVLNTLGAMTAAETETIVGFGATGAAVNDLAAGDAISFATITDDASTENDVADAEIILLDSAAAFANVGAAVDAMEDSGGYTITHQANVADDDTFLFAYEHTDGTVHVAAASFEAADDNSGAAGTIGDGALVGVDLVTLTGVTDVTTLDAANFSIV